MNKQDDIFGYIQQMESQYRSAKIPINENWDWNMKEHITLTELYLNSQLKTGKNDYKPVKNITRPILNLQHRTEDIDVKDVQIYVDDPKRYHLSFLVKKYHDDVFVRENDMDTFFDELNVSRIDFGAGLSKKLNKPCPEIVPLQTIAFCDQTDILSGPIGIKHFFSPDQLLEMESKGWGDSKNGATATIEETIRLSREDKKEDRDGRIAQTPGRYIEVYEIHGNLPKRYSNPFDTTEKYETRLWIVCFYQKKDRTDKSGIVLYSMPEKESPFKLIKRDPVHGRALGMGGAEELFEAQVWVNYDMIRMQSLLDSAAKTILGAKGPNSATIAARNKLKDMNNLDIIDLGVDTELAQIDTFPKNIKLFENSVAQWEAHAQMMGAANDSLMGENPASGTPFKLQELVTQESRGLHEYRRGQYAKHLEEIYTDWVIPHISKKITEGVKFLSELSVDDLKYVTDAVVECEANKMIIDRVLQGEEVSSEEVEIYKQSVREEFKKKGNKHFIEILKGELKDAPLAVKVSVAGKSKNLALMTDKVVNFFRFAFSNPQGFAQVMQIPGMAKSFNTILEYSGLSPADFSDVDDIANPPQPQEPPQDQMMMSPVQPPNPQQQPAYT